MRGSLIAESKALEHLIFMTDAQPQTTDEQMSALRQDWWTRCGAECYAHRRPLTNRRDPDRVLRVGYVSGDFKSHSAAFSFAPIITAHTQQIEPYYYSTLPLLDYDRWSYHWAETHQATWRDVSRCSPVTLAQMIRSDAIDILVDLSGWSEHNRLLTFAMRPAPIQVQAWGYVTGTGTPALDAVFADRVTASTENRRHMERVVDLPSILTYYPRPDVLVPEPLPARAPVFGVFQRALKVNAETVAVWRQILEQLPESTIRFQGAGYTPTVQAQIRGGFGPYANRIRFCLPMDHLDHMNSYADVDLSLDPWPQTGGVSTLDGLWMGVPTVTLIGPRMIQRTSASFLSTLQLDDFIARTPHDYVDLAIEWVTSWRPSLSTIRTDLRDTFRQSPILVAYGEAVERACRDLWHEWCATGAIAQPATAYTLTTA